MSDVNDRAPPAELLEAHLALHTWLEDRTYDVLARLVACDVEGARASFEEVARVLEEHMRFEDERVLPAYAPVAPKDGPGRADHVEGDHVILLRHVDAIDALLADLESAAARRTIALREVLERLPVVYRLLATLEHHTAREQQSVYPAVARVLDDAALADVVRALRAQVTP